MELGIDSFASTIVGIDERNNLDYRTTILELLQRIQKADEVGLDVFGIGEHYRKEFADAASPIILAAAAQSTKNIKLTSAVSVLSVVDPVRLFQQFATIDLISNGRAEIVVGRGSSIEGFPLFGFNLQEYDAIFKEKLELLLKIRAEETITWQGKYRSQLIEQSIYPRPQQEKIPIWLGVGGSPSSFKRAGQLGMPLMVAIIGGEVHRFRPLIDMYREAGNKAGYATEDLKVGIHVPGYLSETDKLAKEEYFPGYQTIWTKMGKERGWPPVTHSQFEKYTSILGALFVGSAESIAEKIEYHNQTLGGIDRLTFQMDMASINQDKLLRSIELIGTMKKMIS
ncbi:LLM class flavin-dependent oxidoreductase [Flavobacterium sp. J27]|uniref:LLM class flavin-dependent oxidoreductase n=1 Tax=Flavobacterium sp. J27 TaxID=2060419 RepID=UPI0010326936|nr:LLM class flavin-dependent oxidoreductase [Flavobacterium sp. J27]